MKLGVLFSAVVLCLALNAEMLKGKVVRVADGDMGKVIGRQGKIVKQIRILMRAVAQRKGKKISVEILD